MCLLNPADKQRLLFNAYIKNCLPAVFCSIWPGLTLATVLYHGRQTYLALSESVWVFLPILSLNLCLSQSLLCAQEGENNCTKKGVCVGGMKRESAGGGRAGCDNDE